MKALKVLSLAGRFLLPAVCLVAAGCANYQLAYNEKISIGAYKEAAEIAVKRADKKDGDELLWRLQAGSANSYCGNAAESIRQFDLAEDIFVKNDNQSVFASTLKGADAMLTNDLAFDYNGKGLDRIFCCMYKAVDFALLGKMDAARNEFNRAAMHQENWAADRKKDIEAAYLRLGKEAADTDQRDGTNSDVRTQRVSSISDNGKFVEMMKTNTGFDPVNSGDLEKMAAADYTSAYLAHFCGIFRWINGDGGRNFLRDAMALKPDNPVVKQDYINIDRGKKPKNSIWIYVEDGLCANRGEWKINIPSFLIPWAGRYVMAVSMAYPVLRERAGGNAPYTIEAGGRIYPMPVLESVDRLIKAEYDVFMRGAVKRELTRVVVRTTAQVALGIAADNTSDSTAKMVLRLSQASMAAWGMASAKADTRSWESLPKFVMMQRIDMPADGKVVIKAADMHPLELAVGKGNAIIWVRRPTNLAPPVAKIIQFK